ncbi:galactokinase [Tamaricihabitans halophyticus]|uniref:Galactokinase n=1 Tax=Tamaricihabitans halophyticus TaxID=1262583 RepID=A0A4R2R0G5_9PSEU|nr:galactokinase family protein [Tamaricihabitans halophyticus]TCP55194.1 galactokinase [Tamaricihabitans halophyticus]
MTLVDTVGAAFVERHGRRPAGVWVAPGRVNVIGEHTDYNDGFVLPFALPHRIAVAGTARSDGMLTLCSVGSDGRAQQASPVRIDELVPGTVSGWAAYPAGVAWVLRAHGYASGADLVLRSDVPTGAGLSSSAALECAVALALLGLAGVGPSALQDSALQDTARQESVPRESVPAGPSRATIARWAQRAENEFVGMPSGILDQTASMCCTEGHALFLDVRSGEQEQVPFRSIDEGLEILVIDTRSNHALIESGYGDRRNGCAKAAELLSVPALRDIAMAQLGAALAELPAELAALTRHVVTENQRVLDVVTALRSGSTSAIGGSLTASHVSLRDDYQVSCAELDLAVDTAIGSGALGARMIGGGFGGSAIALVRQDQRAGIERTVYEAFRSAGYRSPRTFTAVPSAGAGQVC